MPTFSVVIPAYNAAAFIGTALDSVARQTHRDFEIVVIDDGSIDATSQRVESWRKDHPEIALTLHRQPNMGIGGSRNSGIERSKGDFVAFLDADDTWSSEKLDAVARYLREHPETDLVCHNEWLDRGNGVRRPLLHGPFTSYEDLLFRNNTISTSAVTVRRARLERVGGFSEDLEINGVEDYDLWLRLARDGCRIGYLRKLLGTYRIHGEGTTADVDKHLNHTLNVLRAHFQGFGNHTRRMRKRQAGAFKDAGHALMLGREHRRARAMFRDSLSLHAFSWRTWLLMLANEFRIRI